MSDIVKVVGNIDGKDVIFMKVDGGDGWSVSVPSDLDGEYILTVTAYDEAGNVSSISDIVFVVDIKNLTFQVLEPKYRIKELFSIFSYKIIENPYYYKVVSDR